MRSSTKSSAKSHNIRTLTAVGVFSALAYVCCVVFHFKASFLSFDLKDAVMTVGAMFFGPVYGFAMSLVVSVIEAVTISDTGPYGFIMNVLSSTVFVCVGSLIYSKFRTMKGAVVGMISSCIAMVAVMLGANLIITPYYMNTSVSTVAAMIPTLLLPFNATKALFNASVVFLIYKPVATAVRSAGFVPAGKDSELITPKSSKKNVRQVIIIAASLVIAVLCLLFFFLKLNGTVELG